MNEILFQAVVVLHLLGMAVILGGVVTELFARRLGVPAPVLARRSVLDGRIGLPVVGLLAFGNVLVAVYW
jgi:hypothetical protein